MVCLKLSSDKEKAKPTAIYLDGPSMPTQELFDSLAIVHGLISFVPEHHDAFLAGSVLVLHPSQSAIIIRHKMVRMPC